MWLHTDKHAERPSMALSIKPSVIIIKATPIRTKRLKSLSGYSPGRWPYRNDSHPDPLQTSAGWQTSFKPSELVQTNISP